MPFQPMVVELQALLIKATSNHQQQNKQTLYIKAINQSHKRRGKKDNKLDAVRLDF